KNRRCPATVNGNDSKNPLFSYENGKVRKVMTMSQETCLRLATSIPTRIGGVTCKSTDERNKLIYYAYFYLYICVRTNFSGEMFFYYIIKKQTSGGKQFVWDDYLFH